MIWASSGGIFQADVTGENVTTLLPRDELTDSIVDEITWFENILYIVANKTLKIYNRTDGVVGKLGEKETVDSVAIDWIGKRLYWSNHQQQVINRGTLDGKQHEPLPVVAPARQIRIDALRGNIYYSTELTVEGCRMNGKIPKKYFTVPPYSGKQVMGLTLDLDKERIYWIVKSYQGSSLYSAKLLDSWINKNEPEIIDTRLEEKTLSGSLMHFSDRLAWRHDDKSIVFADINGRNLAFFSNEKVSGLTCFTVIDETHRVLPKISGSINVIPDAIPNASIQIQGTYKFFNITWDPVTNVNYGSVFYEIKIKQDFEPDINAEQTDNVFQFPANTLEPYTSLEILIRAFTFWGSSPISKINTYSPTGLPSAPTSPRVYTRHTSYPLEDDVRVSAIFRWSLPKKPNGEIRGYKVNCYEFRSDGEKILRDNRTVTKAMEQVFNNLTKNDRYTFEVLACTSVGDGATSGQIYVSTTNERPVPKVYVSTQEDIVEMDLDQTPPTESHIQTRLPVVAFAHIAYERKLFWFDENNDLISYHSETKTKTKLINTTSPVKCMTIDWLERIVYWSQMIDDNKCIIYSLNLNRAEYLESKKMSDPKLAQKVLERENVISDLAISPFDRKLFWIENHKNLSEESGIFYFELDTGSIKMLFEDNEICMNKASSTISPTPGSLVFATSPINPRNDENEEHQTSLIFEVNNVIPTQFVVVELQTKKCFVFGSIEDRIAKTDNTNIAKDSNKVYWIHEGMVYGREDATNKVISMPVPNKSNRLLAFYQQRYPNRSCLVPQQASYKVKVNESTDVSLKLELPKPELPSNCNLTKIPIRYTIRYTDVKNKDENFDQLSCESSGDCYSIDTFERMETIENLKPFTNYFVQVAMSSVFDKTNKTWFVARANFMTERGRPSPPRNLSALTLSFNEILVTWLAPETFNSPNLTYEINWQQENIVDHIRNKQQQMLHHNNTNSDELISTVIKVLPNQTYSIFVRAYSKNGTFSESESVYLSSYPEPPPIVRNNTTSTSMIIMWKQPENVSSFAIVYSDQESLEPKNVSTLLLQDESNNKFFQIDQLEPKTKYNFTMLLKYVNSDKTYRWSPTTKIEFETKCDVPSPPGRPFVKRVTEIISKISWTPSKDNGAQIEFYVLESRRVSNLDEYEKENSLRTKRAAVSTEFDDEQSDAEHEAVTEPPFDVDHEQDEKWTERYAGSESHYLANIEGIDKYIFRVKANNSYGFSVYSLISDFANSTYPLTENTTLSSDKPNILLLMISVPITIILLGVIFVCTILSEFQSKKVKIVGIITN